ncbi:MAG TPA: tetratricopeptide repeat protein [Candidatus Omnitrophota bacterium]|nr:tetratricopeptide repeat protein [Candidatus Omnitrophota bacterium]HQL40788.1 tetratricopeptide repeat protein [Candidatus Omnitrophota bacterium]
MWNAKNNWVYLGILAVAVFVVFGNALSNGFVYDDHYLIKDNEFIRNFSNLPEVLTSDVAVVTPIAKPSGYYRPVSMLFLMLMYQLWGLNTFGLHLTSLLLHLGTTFLVFLLISQMALSKKTGLITALIFAVHPIHVEAVAPIFNYMGVLASFLSLLSFWFFLQSTKTGDKKYFLFSVVFCFLAIFAKEEAIVLPAIFVLYDLYFIAEFRFRDLARRLMRYAWFVLPAACYIAARVFVMQKAAALGFWHLNLGFNIISDGGVLAQVAMFAKTFLNYFWILIYPFRLSAFYLLPQPETLSAVEIFLSFFIVGSILSFAITMAKRYRLASFFALFFFITSFMISNIIPIGGLFAERFMYLPSVSFCFFLAWVIVEASKRLSKHDARQEQMILGIGLVLVLGLYGQASASRNYIWRNDVTLWSDTCQKTPRSAKPFHYLGDAYAYHGSAYYDKALEAYRQALQRPDAQKIALHSAIGTLYGLMGQHDLALIEFSSAFRLDQNSVSHYYNLGVTHHFLGEHEKALAYFQAGQDMDKNYFWLYYGMGLVYQKQGKVSAARDMFTRALKIEPRFEAAKTALEKL